MLWLQNLKWHEEQQVARVEKSKVDHARALELKQVSRLGVVGNLKPRDGFLSTIQNVTETGAVASRRWPHVWPPSKGLRRNCWRNATKSTRISSPAFTMP